MLYTGTVAAFEEAAGVHGLQASKRPRGGLLAASGVPGRGGAISVSAQLAHLQRLVSVAVHPGNDVPHKCIAPNLHAPSFLS